MFSIPRDFLSIVKGYDDLKEVIVKSLTAPRPVHVLLVGPPSSGKSIILDEVCRLGGIRILGGCSTKAGIIDIIVEAKPKLLVIDEIDKIKSGREIGALLSWMENGRVIVAKHRRYIIAEGDGWVYAAANDVKQLSRMSPELVSRFLVLKLKPYSKSEFIEVAEAMLVEREGVRRGKAREIAEAMSKYTRDVRMVRHVARLCMNSGGISQVLKTVLKYS
ncbi:MAG: hypothetical protein QXV23_04975 [Candidatus Bathyarchaeia archaeon]